MVSSQKFLVYDPAPNCMILTVQDLALRMRQTESTFSRIRAPSVLDYLVEPSLIGNINNYCTTHTASIRSIAI